MVNEKPFERADGDRAILLNPLAFLLARMGAGISEDTRKGKGLPHKGKRFFKFTRRNESNVSLGIDMHWTGGPAWRRPSFCNAMGAGHGLGIELIDRRSGDQSFFKIIGNLNGADLDTFTTGLAGFDGDITGLLMDEDFEISGTSFNLFDACIGQDLNVSMPSRIHQFGR
jgi:hypothetical protein